ncbi:hypothetical protein CPB85DRAFT_1561388 [Mucidula mucida]|nr:hypothetical protein CPB85DRAFT_1561388 [Mucidula mucida]
MFGTLSLVFTAIVFSDAARVSAQKELSGLEELRRCRFNGHDLRKLLPNTPNLRILKDITLGKFHNATILKLLASCKQLTHIGVSGEANQAFIDAAKERYVVDTIYRTGSRIT